MKKSSQILTIAAPESLRQVIEKNLKNHSLSFANTLEEGLAYLKENSFSLVLFEMTDPNFDAQNFKKIHDVAPKTTIVVTSQTPYWSAAIEALQEGAYDYLPQPFEDSTFILTVNRALNHPPTSPHRPAWEMVGSCEAIRELFFMIKRVAPSESTILIQGESGTGKELAARAIHNNSRRHLNNFVSVNCGAFTPTLLESELFGHVKGAFTGADRNKQGLVEVAAGGSFFLDEVSEMPLDLQVKLLRLLEEKEFIPVGANQSKKVDVRFICATNRRLAEEVKAGTFREDLFYRLNVIPLYLPPLRERGEDILTIANRFITHYRKQMNSTIQGLSEDVKAIFLSYSWPGNVRELENAIQRTLALAPAGRQEIQPKDLEDRLRSQPPSHSPPFETTTSSHSIEPEIPQEGFDLTAHLDQLEKTYIVKALNMAQGNKAKAAQLLGIKTRSLNYKIDKYNIS